MTQRRHAYTIRRAVPGDLRDVARLLADSAAWMHQRGHDAWPADGFPDERIMLDIADGTCWLLKDHEQSIATLVLDSRPDVEFIAAGLATDGEPVMDAYLVHKMAVDRTRAGVGIGGLLLDWATDRAAASGRDWVWLNVARRARPLQAWYISHGFELMTIVTSTGRKSGALWRRSAMALPSVREHIREIVNR